MANDVLRTIETIERYRNKRRSLGGDLANVDLLTLPRQREFEFWVLVENEFPYDMIAEKHQLLVPRRWFIDEFEMSVEERNELTEIKIEFAGTKEFDCIMENIKHKRTVPNQFHLHCLKYKYVTPLSELK